MRNYDSGQIYGHACCGGVLGRVPTLATDIYLDESENLGTEEDRQVGTNQRVIGGNRLQARRCHLSQKGGV